MTMVQEFLQSSSLSSSQIAEVEDLNWIWLIVTFQNKHQREPITL